jgi:hypothetical protein
MNSLGFRCWYVLLIHNKHAISYLIMSWYIHMLFHTWSCLDISMSICRTEAHKKIDRLEPRIDYDNSRYTTVQWYCSIRYISGIIHMIFGLCTITKMPISLYSTLCICEMIIKIVKLFYNKTICHFYHIRHNKNKIDNYHLQLIWDQFIETDNLFKVILFIK